MDTSSNLTNLVILSAIGSTAMVVDYITPDSIAPEQKATYVFDDQRSYQYPVLKDNLVLSASFNTDSEKVNTLLRFSKHLVTNSEELDSEFSRIVSENFIDLL